MELKFRAWDDLESRMLTAYDVDNLLFMNRSSSTGVYNIRRKAGVNNIIQMQYIPVKDKQGIQLCDRDVVIAQGNIFEMPVVLEVRLWPDEYPTSIMLISKDNHCEISMVDGDLKKIGNSLENPELLEKA